MIVLFLKDWNMYFMKKDKKKIGLSCFAFSFPFWPPSLCHSRAFIICLVCLSGSNSQCEANAISFTLSPLFSDLHLYPVESMATPDHLFNLRNNFYLGAYQAAINSSDVNNLSPDDAIERDCLVHRCYIALGQLQVYISSEFLIFHGFIIQFPPWSQLSFLSSVCNQWDRCLGCYASSGS